jgi:hypothetical protein
MGHRPLRCDTTLPAATSTLFDTAYAEAVDDLLQNWSKGLKFVLPDFHVISEFHDHIEWRNTNTIFIFPEWSKAYWWQWLAVVMVESVDSTTAASNLSREQPPSTKQRDLLLRPPPSTAALACSSSNGSL